MLLGFRVAIPSGAGLFVVGRGFCTYFTAHMVAVGCRLWVAAVLFSVQSVAAVLLFQ